MAGIVKGGWIPGQQQQTLGPKPGGYRSPSLTAAAPAAAAPAPPMDPWGSMPPMSSPAPVEADTSYAAPALQGLAQAAEDPAAGFTADGTGAGLNPNVGRRTPPQAMQMLSRLSRVY